MPISSDGSIFTTTYAVEEPPLNHFSLQRFLFFRLSAVGLKESEEGGWKLILRNRPILRPAGYPALRPPLPPPDPHALGRHPDAAFEAAGRGHTYFTFANPGLECSPGRGQGRTLCSKAPTRDWSLPAFAAKAWRLE